MLVPLMNATFMPPLTRHLLHETIRNPDGIGIRDWGFAIGLTAIALYAGGCATAGQNHLYVTTQGGEPMRDFGPAGTPAATVASHTEASDTILGLAYDFNTDHLFLRLAPGNVVRVIERPSGRLLREMVLPKIPTGAMGWAGTETADLAIRSSDRHLFLVLPDGRSVAEFTLLGHHVRTQVVKGLSARIGGLAYDQKNGRLLALLTSSPAQIATISSDGNASFNVTLSEAVHPVSLGYDSAAEHYFVPLTDGHNLGEFHSNGQLATRTLLEHAPTGIDAGTRSFVRIF